MVMRGMILGLCLVIVSACSTTQTTPQLAAQANLEDGDGDHYSSRSYTPDIEAFSLMENSQEEGVRAHDRVFFAFDSAVLDTQAQDTLDRQVKYLQVHAGQRVLVEGHCDERGTREYNLALGERRAQAVKNYLVAAGIEGVRVRTISYGKERPAIASSTPAAYAANRRAVTLLNE